MYEEYYNGSDYKIIEDKGNLRMTDKLKPPIMIGKFVTFHYHFTYRPLNLNYFIRSRNRALTPPPCTRSLDPSHAPIPPDCLQGTISRAHQGNVTSGTRNRGSCLLNVLHDLRRQTLSN